jgi:hypothetical protein
VLDWSAAQRAQNRGIDADHPLITDLGVRSGIEDCHSLTAGAVGDVDRVDQEGVIPGVKRVTSRWSQDTRGIVRVVGRRDRLRVQQLIGSDIGRVDVTPLTVCVKAVATAAGVGLVTIPFPKLTVRSYVLYVTVS